MVFQSDGGRLEGGRGFGCGGRLIQEEKPCNLSIYTDAAELGWGATVSHVLEAGIAGEEEAELYRERKDSITWREQREFQMLLESTCRERVATDTVRRVLLNCENMAVVFIIRKLVNT